MNFPTILPIGNYHFLLGALLFSAAPFPPPLLLFFIYSFVLKQHAVWPVVVVLECFMFKQLKHCYMHGCSGILYLFCLNYKCVGGDRVSILTVINLDMVSKQALVFSYIKHTCNNFDSTLHSESQVYWLQVASVDMFLHLNI